MGEVRKVGATELLNLRDKAWSRSLRGSSLVAEVDIPDHRSVQVASVLGRVYAKWVASGRTPGTFFTRWPACVAVAMTAVAARDYRQGQFWRSLWTAIGHPGGVDEQPIWGKGFATALDALGMPTFPDMPMPYVGPILMHTGIPTFCLEDYFRLLVQRAGADPGLDAEGFLDWATEPGKETRIGVLDVPARRFLQHGTEYAHDFVERSFDLVDRLRDRVPDLDGVGLPARVLARAQELTGQGRLKLDRHRVRRGGGIRREHPRIALDPFGRGVEVVLPAISDTPDGLARWNVTADGVTTTIRSQAQWAGVAEGAPSTTFSLLRPVRTVVVELAGWFHQAELQVIDPAAPLLLFAEDGRRLSPALPPAPDVVWAVYPAEHELVADGDLGVVVEGQLPLGWNGWRLRQVSLEHVRSLGLAGIPASRRQVRGHTRPRILTGDPVAGAATPYGTPVHAAPPKVWLPGQAGADTTWLIDVRMSGEDTPLVSRSRTVGEPTTVDDLWDAVPRPLLGAYEITVRGPLGRGTRLTVFVAEGLTTRFFPRVRMFGVAGLVAGRAEIGSADGAAVIPSTVGFAADALSGVVEYRTGTATEPLVVTPAHLQVMHERADSTLKWRAGPLRIVTDVFAEEPGCLFVRIPGARFVPPLRVVVGGQSVQDVPPNGAAQGGTARYDLTRIADTVHEHQRADLLLDLDGVVIRLVCVRPRQLARGVEHAGGLLRLAGHVAVDGLSAGVYPAAAPWRDPLVVPVDPDGGIPLPPELRQAGPLLVHLQVDDPWVPAEWPRRPDHHFVAGGEGHFTGDDPEETELSRFVAGSGPFPAGIEDLRRIWTLIDLAPSIRPLPEVPHFRRSCSRPLLAEPAKALATLVDLGLEPGRLIVALIASGLAASAVPGSAGSAPARRMWPVAPAAAVLAGDLTDPDCLAAAERQCGEALTRILGDGVDPLAAVGRFGPEVERMAHLSPQQIEGIWRAADVVPRALLDADTRMSAARRLFDARGEEPLRLLGQVALQVADAARTLLKRKELTGQIDRRRHPRNRRGWYSAPAASAAFALVARRAARGDTACRAAEQTFRADWVRLATVAPDLVAIDLVLAELLIGPGAERS
ncbi:hypothetical protein [Rhizohabitans arisaemae]|uniref:hypothetical protein n=1 Tax=Rhizohabitans arisaemae TaxID=2720610 RepID=UPI0024B154BE|nr:hypothetical protein [Rhizohabitans arisaemae]